jgi:ABC-2 type transport system ATP-binding protein
MSTPAIEARGLTKRYAGMLAVDRLDLKIDSGVVFGLLGPNGSGKTTTILMLLGLTDVTSGTVRVLGLDPVRRPLDVKSTVGYMPDSVGFYDDLTARENLRYSGKLMGLRGTVLESRIDGALRRVRLLEAAGKPARAFSRGMRQRLGLAEVLLKQPRLAILDEPTSGLDPQSTAEFLEMIRGLKADGITVLLSSHLLDQVQAVCDRAGLFHRGRMVLEGGVDELARKVLGGGYRITVETRGGDRVADRLRGISGVNRVEEHRSGLFVLHAECDVRPQAAAAVSTGAGGELLGLAMQEPNLNDVYADYFKEEMRRAA